jgi:hypothetical protein
MPLLPDEKKILENIQSNVIEIHADMADVKAKLVQHGADIRSHQARLDRHDYRIGTLEFHIGIGPVGQNPMVNPLGHRARMQPMSVPPKSPEELGLEATDSGTTWKTKDAAAVVRRFEEQEQQRLGAEQALELERKKFDRKLRNFSAIAALVVLLVGSAVGAATFLYTHVSVVAPAPARR